MEAAEKVTLEKYWGWAKKDREITEYFYTEGKREKKSLIFLAFFHGRQYSQTRRQLHAWLHRSTLKKPNQIVRLFLFNNDPFVSV